MFSKNKEGHWVKVKCRACKGKKQVWKYSKTGYITCRACGGAGKVRTWAVR